MGQIFNELFVWVLKIKTVFHLLIHTHTYAHTHTDTHSSITQCIEKPQGVMMGKYHGKKVTTNSVFQKLIKGMYFAIIQI